MFVCASMATIGSVSKRGAVGMITPIDIKLHCCFSALEMVTLWRSSKLACFCIIIMGRIRLTYVSGIALVFVACTIVKYLFCSSLLLADKDRDSRRVWSLQLVIVIIITFALLTMLKPVKMKAGKNCTVLRCLLMFYIFFNLQTYSETISMLRAFISQ